MSEFMKPYWQIREMVKDPSLKAKDIAEKTGYKLGYVYNLRRTIMAREAGKLARRLEQKAMIDGLIAEAVAKEREACAKICADIAMHRNLGSYGMMVAHTCANEIKARGK